MFMTKLQTALVVLGVLFLLSHSLGCQGNVFAKYDFSFEYSPDTEEVYEEGSEREGQFAWKVGPKSYSLWWYSGIDVPAVVQAFSEDPATVARLWAQFMGEGTGWETFEDPSTMELCGYRVGYQYLMRQSPADGFVAVWYCEDIDKMFQFNCTTSATSGFYPESDLANLMTSFETHP